MHLHALTSKMVPDANSLSIEELPEVATSQNNAEYRLNYNKFYQGRIDSSFCGDGPFCSLKQVLINTFSDSSNAMLVLDGYCYQKIRFLYLFDSHARNSLGIPDENETAVVLKFSELNEFQNHVVISQLFSTEGISDPSKDEFVKLLLSLKDIVVTYNKRSKVATNILTPHT